MKDTLNGMKSRLHIAGEEICEIKDMEIETAQNAKERKRI